MGCQDRGAMAVGFPSLVDRTPKREQGQEINPWLPSFLGRIQRGSKTGGRLVVGDDASKKADYRACPV